MGSSGAVWIAFGENAKREAAESMASYRKHNRLPMHRLAKISDKAPEGFTVGQHAHWAKACADRWSPYSNTLMLDADTRVKGDLSVGFEMLWAGWDVVMVPSKPPSSRPGQVLWNLSEPERLETLQELGTWRHLMYNTGVMFFRKSPQVRNLFAAWRKEWLRYKQQDQGAFLRALNRCPVRLWILGYPFNSLGGAVVDHLFGRARA